MLPKYHMLAAAAAAVPLARKGWSSAALAGFVAGAVLIDADHYLGYAWKTGDVSLVRAYRYHHRLYRRPRRWRFRARRPVLSVHLMRAFHSAPVLVLAFAFSCLWPAVRPIAWGALFHRIQDELWGSFE
ncbi:MAG: hypothetical protein HY332_16140 [Chloroflexi bacterium]|nr:hypothetical protein [Chloroflexota bacterium]